MVPFIYTQNTFIQQMSSYFKIRIAFTSRGRTHGGEILLLSIVYFYYFSPQNEVTTKYCNTILPPCISLYIDVPRYLIVGS